MESFVLIAHGYPLVTDPFTEPEELDEEQDKSYCRQDHRISRRNRRPCVPNGWLGFVRGAFAFPVKQEDPLVCSFSEVVTYSILLRERDKKEVISEYFISEPFPSSSVSQSDSSPIPLFFIQRPKTICAEFHITWDYNAWPMWWWDDYNARPMWWWDI